MVGRLAKTVAEAAKRGTDFFDPIVDRSWYKAWLSGKVPDRAGAYATNARVPSAEEVIRDGIFCMGVPTIWRLLNGLEVATLGNEDFDGGVVAYFGSTPNAPADYPRRGYFELRGTLKRFSLADAEPYDLLGYKFNSAALGDQGHGAILMPDGTLLESLVRTGPTRRRRLKDCADEFTVMVKGKDWLLPKGATPAPGGDKAIAKPPVEWRPAHSRNFTPANRPNGQAVDRIIVHIVQGSYGSALNWFQNPAAGVSAHYTASKAGKLAQSVSESNIAHHAGNWEYNKRGVGIEHEGFVSDAGFPDAMYRSSAKLTAHLCSKYGIPIDRSRIVGHNEVPGATHTDPGPNWDWGKYVALVKEYSSSPGPRPAPTPADPNDRVKGAAVYSEERVLAFASGRNAHSRTREVIEGIYDYAPKKGLRPDFLSVQYLHETGFGRYGGASRPENPAGIKKAGLRGDAPEDFEVPPTPSEGARMLVNHWCAVYGMDPMGFPHARYSEAKAHYANAFPNGVPDRITSLGFGLWAADGNEPNDPLTYGGKLWAHMGSLAATPEPASPAPPPKPSPDLEWLSRVEALEKNQSALEERVDALEKPVEPAPPEPVEPAPWVNDPPAPPKGEPVPETKPNKAIAAALVGVMGVLAQYVATGEFDAGEFATSLTALVSVALVFLVENRPKGK